VQVRRAGDFNMLKPAEVAAVTQEAAIFTVAAFTGPRLGELRALRWGAIDFTSRSIIVRRNLPSRGEEKTPKSEEKTPKSYKIRSVPLIVQAAVALDGLSRSEHSTGTDDRVFCSATGGAFDDDELRDEFYAALRAGRARAPAGEGRPDRLPRSAEHVRDARRRRLATPRSAELLGARGHSDGDDLRASRAECHGRR
jgi:integrase